MSEGSLAEWDKASMWEKYIFQVANGMLNLGLEKILEQEDLIEVAKHDLATSQTQELEKHFYSLPPSHNRLWKALYLSNKHEFWYTAFWAMGESVTRIMSPIFLKFLLQYLNDEEKNSNSLLASGWFPALGIIVSSLLQVIVHHILFYYTMRGGWNLRTATSGLIHKQLLTLSANHLHTFSRGKLTNLISNDTQRYDFFCVMGHFGWTGMVDMAIILSLISIELDPLSACGGVLLLLLFVPLQIYLAKQFSNLRTQVCVDV